MARHSSASSRFVGPRCCPTTPTIEIIGLGYSPFARRYLGSRFYFPFLQLLRCFSSLGWLVPAYEFSWPFKGLPHSEIPGSKGVSTSPRLIAGNHVLHRLCVPRYPPWALCSLTINRFSPDKLESLGSCSRIKHEFFIILIAINTIKILKNLCIHEMLYSLQTYLCSFQGSTEVQWENNPQRAQRLTNLYL